MHHSHQRTGEIHIRRISERSSAISSVIAVILCYLDTCMMLCDQLALSNVCIHMHTHAYTYIHISEDIQIVCTMCCARQQRLVLQGHIVNTHT